VTGSTPGEKQCGCSAQDAECQCLPIVEFGVRRPVRIEDVSVVPIRGEAAHGDTDGIGGEEASRDEKSVHTRAFMAARAP
jgi:hypothetical protein